ncbi:hypothetical protein EDC17_103923 [Sphingobacterium alimentarium]|uniref:Cyclically-permuted mutarotase family protein n=1 Tax=Sphingobacterium alimentarium TaxID=797292 RepID=A0A4R3VQX3_9SPHI|nr:hypothetical protein [Sphingobacterium alimentarium]TCV09867.1 hypothetical protein EDC17_103923 [Sphingobacterium alimentarium]
MKKTLFFLLCIVNMGFYVKDQRDRIDWLVGEVLPESNGKKNIGVAGPITGIIDDKLIIMGGANFPDKMPWDGGIKAYQKAYYVYQISADGQLELISTSYNVDSLAYSANVSDQGFIYAVGGERNGLATTDVVRISLRNEQLVMENLPSLPIALTNGSAAIIKGYLYFVGGENSDLVSKRIYRLNLKSPNEAWEDFVDLPAPVSHSISLAAQDANLIVIGGRKRNTNAKSDIYKTVYSIDVKTKKLNQLPTLPEPLAAGTAVNYKGNLIVIGGDNGETFHQVEQLIADINTSSDEESKNRLIKEKNALQSSHPGFSKKVYQLKQGQQKWELLHLDSGESPVTTTALLKDNLIIIPSGEIKAGVRTNQILIGKIN